MSPARRRSVLFLDFDGVLNSFSWQRRWEAMPTDPKFGQLTDWERDAERSLDPEAVDRLNRVVNVTECLVVVSSTWRKGYPLTLLTRMLRRRGFEHHLFACTPHIHDWGRRVPRGEEIAWWLNQLGGAPTFAIVDDDSDMEPHLDRLVQTEHEVGLTDADVARLIEMLRPAAKERVA